MLSEQYCSTGEVPDVIGWKASCQSVLVECKVSRADFLADAGKPFRLHPEQGLGSRRIYCAPSGMIAAAELPDHWGLLECRGREIELAVKPGKRDQRSPDGLMKEMGLLLASLRRVEVRIEPQTITDFLKWKNRMADYNGGQTAAGHSGARRGRQLLRCVTVTQRGEIPFRRDLQLTARKTVTPRISVNSTPITNMAKRIFAMAAKPAAIPVNPSTPKTTASTAQINVHLSM